MKILKIISVAIVILLFAGCKKLESNKITISGKVTGEFPEKVEYTLPEEGNFIYGFKKSAKLDSLGRFQINIPLEKIAFVRLMIPKKKPITIIAEPNNEYVVNFDFTKEDASKNFEIHGHNEKAQEVYNKLEVPAHIQIAADTFLKDSIASQIQSKIVYLKEQDLSEFKELLAKDSINQNIYDFIKLDREYYYSAIQGTVGFIKFLTNERKKGVFTDDIKKMWATTFDNDLLTRPDFQKTDWGYALTENYLFYKDHSEFSFDIDKFRNSITNTFYPKKIVANAEKYLSPHSLEYFKAVYLYTELLQKDYQKDFISIVDEFKTTYPKSAYNQYLEPMIAPVVSFHKNAEKPFSEDVKFVENYDKIDNFNDLLSRFKGKKMYLDIWGTWCSPCKKEFQYKDDLKKVLKSKDVELLYICEGRSSKEDVWKNMIKFYGLEGHHVMANKELLADIFKIFGNNGSFYYPRYILIDDNGKTVKSVAAKPSELEKLKKQLSEMGDV